MFRINTNKISIRPNKKIIKADEYQKYIEANSIIQTAEDKAKQILEEADQVYASKKAEGYQDGILEGKMETAEKMLDTALAAVNYLEGLEETIVSLVTTSARKVIGELDDKEVITRVVRQALLQVHSQQKVLIRISPADEDHVRSSMDIMLKSAPGSLSFLDVAVDPRMNKGDCVLESELGILDASLETQLKVIEQSLLSKIKA